MIPRSRIDLSALSPRVRAVGRRHPHRFRGSQSGEGAQRTCHELCGGLRDRPGVTGGGCSRLPADSAPPAPLRSPPSAAPRVRAAGSHCNLRSAPGAKGRSWPETEPRRAGGHSQGSGRWDWHAARGEISAIACSLVVAACLHPPRLACKYRYAFRCFLLHSIVSLSEGSPLSPCTGSGSDLIFHAPPSPFARSAASTSPPRPTAQKSRSRRSSLTCAAV